GGRKRLRTKKSELAVISPCGEAAARAKEAFPTSRALWRERDSGTSHGDTSMAFRNSRRMMARGGRFVEDSGKALLSGWMDDRKGVRQVIIARSTLGLTN